MPGMRRIVGMGRVLERVFLVVAGVVRRFVVAFDSVRRGDDGLDRRRVGRGVRFARDMVVGVIVMMMIVTVVMIVRLRLVAMIVMAVRVVVVMNRIIAMMMLGAVRVGFIGWCAVSVALIGLGNLRGIGRCVLDHVALDAVAMAAAAGIAVARTATVAVGGAVLALFLGFAVGAFVGLDQRLTVGDRDLVIVGMNFAEGEEAVAVAAIFDEGGLQ